MNFQSIANSLLRQESAAVDNEEVDKNKSSKDNKTDLLNDLREAGFSPRKIFQEMRYIYDTTEDDTTRKQMLEMAVKMHGLYSQEETKRIPNIVLNVIGNKEKLDNMLCPPTSSVSPKLVNT